MEREAQKREEWWCEPVHHTREHAFYEERIPVKKLENSSNPVKLEDKRT